MVLLHGAVLLQSVHRHEPTAHCGLGGAETLVFLWPFSQYIQLLRPRLTCSKDIPVELEGILIGMASAGTVLQYFSHYLHERLYCTGTNSSRPSALASSGETFLLFCLSSGVLLFNLVCHSLCQRRLVMGRIAHTWLAYSVLPLVGMRICSPSLRVLISPQHRHQPDPSLVLITTSSEGGPTSIASNLPVPQNNCF